MAQEKTFDAIFSDLMDGINRGHPGWGVDGGEGVAALLCGRLAALRPDIEDEYAAINARTKRKFMDDARGLLDRHKCAAVFMASFLERFELSPDEEKRVRDKTGSCLTKEKFAVIIGLSVMATMVRDELKEWREKERAGQRVDRDEEYRDCRELVAYLDKKNNNFDLPAVICDENPYPHNWVLELRYAHNENRLFVLSLANELFCIEKHNRQVAEIARLRYENSQLEDRVRRFETAQRGRHIGRW